MPSPNDASLLCAMGDARRLSSSANCASPAAVVLLIETSNGMLCVLSAFRTKRFTAEEKLSPREPNSWSALSFRPLSISPRTPREAPPHALDHHVLLRGRHPVVARQSEAARDRGCGRDAAESSAFAYKGRATYAVPELSERFRAAKFRFRVQGRAHVRAFGTFAADGLHGAGKVSGRQHAGP